jgi:hypothetical protein
MIILLFSGSIPWFIVAELFDQKSRSAAVSLAVLTNWFANFCVALGYPEMNVSDPVNPVVNRTLDKPKSCINRTLDKVPI